MAQQKRPLEVTRWSWKADDVFTGASLGATPGAPLSTLRNLFVSPTRGPIYGVIVEGTNHYLHKWLAHTLDDYIWLFPSNSLVYYHYKNSGKSKIGNNSETPLYVGLFFVPWISWNLSWSPSGMIPTQPALARSMEKYSRRFLSVIIQSDRPHFLDLRKSSRTSSHTVSNKH